MPVRRRVITLLVISIFIGLGLLTYHLYNRSSALNQTQELTDPPISTDPYSKKLPASSTAICPNCNILLIGVDTLAYGHTSLSNYSRDTTPFLKQLANSGANFTQNYVQIPYTPPSFWSILTGQYPHTHNLPDPSNLIPGLDVRSSDEPLDMTGIGASPVDSSVPALPRLLASQDYLTRAQISHPVLNSLEPVFTSYDAVNEEVLSFSGEPVYETTNRAKDWLSGLNGKPFFLFVHYWDAHSPYRPTQDYDIFSPADPTNQYQVNAAKYDGEVLFVDHQIELLLSHLDTLELKNNTVIIITSDHGEQFGEKDCTDFIKVGGPCEGHSVSLFQEEIHVPLLIIIPKKESSQIITNPVQSIDIAPTVLDLLGLPLPPTVEGRSLVPLIEGQNWEDQAVLSELSEFTAGTNITSIIKDGWKLMQLFKPGNTLQKLFHLSEGESFNYAEQKPELIRSLLDTQAGIIQGKELPSIDTRDLKPNTLEMLKSLGYL